MSASGFVPEISLAVLESETDTGPDSELGAIAPSDAVIGGAACPAASAPLAAIGSGAEEGEDEFPPDRDTAQTIATTTMKATSRTGPHPDDERGGG